MVTSRILSRDHDGLCPMETLALKAASPEAFFQAVLHELGLGEGGKDGPQET